MMTTEHQAAPSIPELGESEFTAEERDWLKLFDLDNEYAWILSDMTVAVEC